MLIRKKILLFFFFVLFLSAQVYPFGKNKVNYETADWNVMHTIHFDVHYQDGAEELALEAMRISEEAYVLLANSLRHELTEAIPVILYPSHVEFQNTNVLPYLLGEGTGGFTEALKMRVVVPFNGSYYDLRHVLTHELVHAFQYNMLFSDLSGELMSRFSVGRIPLWLIEGMAEYLSIGFDETADMVMRDALFNENYATLMDLTSLRIKSGYLLYKEGQAFYYFLEKKYGREIIGELFRDMRDLRNFKEALKINTGKTLKELNNEWIRFFKKRYYPLVATCNYDDDEGKRLTDHRKSYSSMNISPAISPDGKMIAYLTNKNIYTSVVVRPVEGKKKGKVKLNVLITGNNSSDFEEMHLMSNYLTWSKDSKSIFFAAQSNGLDIIYEINSKTGKILDRIRLPLRSVKDPSVSNDKRNIVFIGSSSASSDVYMYDRKKKFLKRLTFDRFSERYPKILPDGKIIYSSNLNSEGNYHKNSFNLFIKDPENGKTKRILESDFNELQVDVSPDGKEIIYVSNRTGIYNIYKRNLASGDEKKVTNVLSGAFYPRFFPESDRIAFVSYQNLGYDIFIKKYKEEKLKPVDSNEKIKTEYIGVDYPVSYADINNFKAGDYSLRVSPDWLMFGLTGTFNYGFVGFMQLSVSDYLGNHQMVLMSNYIRQEGNNDLNFQAAYYYLKYRWDFGLGAFRQKNPFMIYSVASINDLIHNVNFGTLYMNHYGFYGLARYPFNRFLRVDIKSSVSRYEKDFSIYDSRPDVYANLNQASVSLSYDNILWGAMTPADGFRGELEFEQAVDITGQDFCFSSIDIDLRRYFLLGRRYVFAFRGVAGKIFGQDSDSFKYYLGGYNTLRGHSFLGYSGKNMFLVNSEFRFTFIEGIKFGFPLFFGIGNIGGVLFMDMGSAWDDNYSFTRGGRFDDFKTDFGFGFRLAIYPVIILKLDYAWPYNKKSVGEKDIIFSLGFEY